MPTHRSGIRHLAQGGWCALVMYKSTNPRFAQDHKHPLSQERPTQACLKRKDKTHIAPRTEYFFTISVESTPAC